MSPLYRAILWRRNEGLRGLFIILVLFFAVYAYRFPGILSIGGFSTFTQTWFPLALVAMAQAILMLTGGINLAIGSMVSLGAVVAATTMDGALGVFGGIVAVLAIGALVGAGSGMIVALLRLPAIIVTLALSFILGGVALLILPRPGGAIPVWFSDAFAGSTPTAALVLLILVVLWKLYLATPIGIGIYAVGDNPVGAYRSGVPVAAVRITAYAVSGALTSLAGLFMAAKTGSGDPLIGAPQTLNSIAAAVLGGVGFLGGSGTMRGALAGSLLLTVMINVMFFLDFPPVAQYIAQGLIIVGAVALPQVIRPYRRKQGTAA
jgi:ribose transport system permease protein